MEHDYNFYNDLLDLGNNLFQSFAFVAIAVLILNLYVLIRDRGKRPDTTSWLLDGVNALLLYSMFQNFWVHTFATEVTTSAGIRAVANLYSVISISMGILWIATVGVTLYRTMRYKNVSGAISQQPTSITIEDYTNVNS